MRYIKETSKKANKTVPRVTHKKMILDVLTTPLTNSEISEKTYFKEGYSLLTSEVAKRTSELEADNILFDAGQRNGSTIYWKVHKDGLQGIKLSAKDKKRKRYIKRLENLLSDFKEDSCIGFRYQIADELIRVKFNQ